MGEEYANKYLLNISAEVQRQSFFLDGLEERWEALRKLPREAVDLQMLYESGAVATMQDPHATGRETFCRFRKQSIETWIFSTFVAAFKVPCPVQRGRLGVN